MVEERSKSLWIVAVRKVELSDTCVDAADELDVFRSVAVLSIVMEKVAEALGSNTREGVSIKWDQ